MTKKKKKKTYKFLRKHNSLKLFNETSQDISGLFKISTLGVQQTHVAGFEPELWYFEN